MNGTDTLKAVFCFIALEMKTRSVVVTTTDEEIINVGFPMESISRQTPIVRARIMMPIKICVYFIVVKWGWVEVFVC